MPRSRSRSPLPALGGAYAPARRRRGNRLPSRYALFLFLLWLPCVVKVKRPKACATRSLPYFPTCTQLFRSSVFFSLLSPPSTAVERRSCTGNRYTVNLAGSRPTCVAIQRIDLSRLPIENSISRATCRRILKLSFWPCRVCKCQRSCRGYVGRGCLSMCL